MFYQPTEFVSRASPIMVQTLRQSKLRKKLIAAALLTCLAALYDAESWFAEPGISEDEHRFLSTTKKDLSRPSRHTDPAPLHAPSGSAPTKDPTASHSPSGPANTFTVCGRTAGFHPASWSRQQDYRACPTRAPRARALARRSAADARYWEYRDLQRAREMGMGTLVLEGRRAYGRTGNRLRAFLRAAQRARDEGLSLAVTEDSWAMKTLAQLFYGSGDAGWKSRMEESLCITIRRQTPWRRQYDGLSKSLFNYQTTASKEDHVASQLHMMRTLWQHHNTAAGRNGTKVENDMCSGIDALFANADNKDGASAGHGEDPRSTAAYSVVHLRSFEGKGRGMLAKAAKESGCDPAAAQDMTPEYVKSILAPLGMLAHPVVVISDNQKDSKKVLTRLLGDPEIGSTVRVVPSKFRWLGGDMTLAVMVSKCHVTCTFPVLSSSHCPFCEFGR